MGRSQLHHFSNIPTGAQDERGGPWIACLAALPSELAGLRRQMTVQGAEKRPGVSWQWGRIQDRRVLLVQTGMGAAAAERATRLILDRYTPAALISFGFAGALSPSLEAGDLVLCRELRSEGDGREVVCPDAALLAAALALPLPGRSPILGSCLTVDRVVSRPEEKRALGERFQAHILEMESYWIGQACAGRGIPFLAVRAVLDGVGQRLPPLESLTGPTGSVQWQAALRYFGRHPWDLLEVAKLARTAQAAQKELTGFMRAFLQNR